MANEGNTSKNFGLQPRRCGDYLLVPHERWMMYRATREDGQEIPKRLQGCWKEYDDFRKAAEGTHGEAYTWDNLQEAGKS